MPLNSARQVARCCWERILILEKLVLTKYLAPFNERRHITSESAERGYYNMGYLQALKDVRDLIDVGKFPASRSEYTDHPSP